MKFSTLLKRAGFRKMKKSEIGDNNCYEKNEIFVEIVDYGSWEACYAYVGNKKHTFEELDELKVFLKENEENCERK